MTKIRLTVDLSTALHGELRTLARQRRETMSAVMRSLLQRAVSSQTRADADLGGADPTPADAFARDALCAVIPGLCREPE